MENDNDVVHIPTPEKLNDTYIRTFRMQATGADGQTIRVSVPRDVVRKEARKHGMSMAQFLEHFRIEWRYNSFPGFYGCFVRMDSAGGVQPGGQDA